MEEILLPQAFLRAAGHARFPTSAAAGARGKTLREEAGEGGGRGGGSHLWVLSAEAS